MKTLGNYLNELVWMIVANADQTDSNVARVKRSIVGLVGAARKIYKRIATARDRDAEVKVVTQELLVDTLIGEATPSDVKTVSESVKKVVADTIEKRVFHADDLSGVLRAFTEVAVEVCDGVSDVEAISDEVRSSLGAAAMALDEIKEAVL